MSLEQYERAFSQLRVNRQKGRISPHKPCMLLALLQLAEAGGLEENEIRFTPALLEPYNEIFDLLRTPNDHPNPYFPFFHLQGDGFWHLKPRAGRETVVEAMNSARSRADIEENFEHAYVDEALFELLKDAEGIGVASLSLIQAALDPNFRVSYPGDCQNPQPSRPAPPRATARRRIECGLVCRMGYRLSDVARYFGRDAATVASLLARLETKVITEAAETKAVERMVKIVNS